MICLLYHNVFCLASASKVDQFYTIQACINLASIKIEETDNGRGLQRFHMIARVSLLTLRRSSMPHSSILMETCF